MAAIANDCFGFRLNNAAHDGWAGMVPETGKYLKSVSGVEGVFLKMPKYAIEWVGHADPSLVSESMASLRDELGPMKDFMGIPKTFTQMALITKAGEDMVDAPSCWNAWKIFVSVFGLVSPVNDSARFVNSRVMDLPSGALANLGHLNAASITVVMGHLSAVEAYKIGDVLGCCGNNYKDDQIQTQLLLSVITLAKTISYLALAALCLFSAFIATIPALSFYILVLATSGTVSSILESFANRAYTSGIDYRWMATKA